MNLLENLTVVALDEAQDSALARLVVSLGAEVVAVSLAKLRETIATADVLIDRIGTALLEDAGFSRESIDAINPSLVHVSVTPFGSTGPRARWRGPELVASAMSGILRLTGDPDRPPVKEALDACWFHADMAAASGLTAALFEREHSRRGQHVDVSVQEVALSRNVNGVLSWQFDRRKLQRVGGALNYGIATVRCIWPLADGFCFHTLMTGRFGAPANRALSDWIDEAGLDNPLRDVHWDTYNRSTLDPAVRTQWEVAIERFFRTRTRHDITTEGRRRGINATVLATPADVLTDPHLQAREFWDDQCRPRRFVAITRGPQTHAAPESSIIPLAPNVRAENPSQRPGPLQGIRVLDFSWALVGSITTKVLGDLGADVIKVESRGRPCLSRIDVQVRVSKPGNFDDKPWFAHLNSSKRSLALDMKHPASRDVLDPLIDWADVVVENFSPGTMAKLGLDYATLAKRNPNLIMVSGSVFGQTGPLAQTWGVDGTGGALSGRTYLTGWPDRGPVIPGSVPYGDVIVPYVMAAAVTAALRYRQQHGIGCHIDAAMYEICVQQMYEAIVAATQGKPPGRSGNDDPRVFHQGVYATQGEDRWIAVSLQSAAEWERVRAHFDLPVGDSAERRHAALSELAARHLDHALAEQLQALGIAAGAVQDIEDVLDRDPQIAARGALVTLDHPLLGPFGHVRTPITFSRSIVEPYRPPRIGEHSHDIARHLSGLDDTRIAELEQAGVFK
jgi:crotonobetainyl-CoA:carnitine CoA-transferase CaiB-like acyl-CoA transferase